MNDARDRSDTRIDELLGRLPQEISPPEDGWPVVAAAITSRSADADALVARLPQEVAPPADLWSRIEAGLSRRDPPGSVADKTGWWPGLALLAASVAFVAFAGLLLVRLDLFEGPVVPGGETVAIDAIGAWAMPAVFDSGSVASPALAAAFEETRQTYLEQITAVRGQRETIEESLALYPNDSALRELWLYAYETELLLIDEAGRVLTTIQTGLQI
jgi:hypothetical protein